MIVFNLNAALIGNRTLEERKRTTLYPKRFMVSSPEMLEQIVQNYDICMNKPDRSAGSPFTGSTLLFADVDEGLPLNEALKQIEGIGVEAYLWTSKNHQKEKNGKVCDRYHIFFPIPEIKDEALFRAYYERVSIVFPERDKGMNADNPFLGYEGSTVYYREGIPITEYLDTLEPILPRITKQKTEETILCGARNATLFDRALKCLKLDWTEDEIYEYLSYLNDTVCEEPLPEAEIRSIITSISKYKCQYALSQLTFNQIPKTFLEQKKESPFLYNSMNDDLLYYENGIYKPDYGLTKLHNEYVKFFDNLLKEKMRISSKSPHYSVLEKLGTVGQRDLYKYIPSTKKLCRVVNDGDFNSERNLLNLRNGVFNLEKGELEDFNPKYQFTFQMNASFNPEATCPLWLSFLDETFEGNQDLINFVQKSVGYTLSGYTNEKKIFICHGKGNTGKTTFIETLQYLMGDFSRTINPRTLDKSTEKSWELAEIVGKRLLTISETDENFVFSNTVKALSGNSTTLSVEAKYKKPIEITPFVKIWIDTNNKPLLTTGDRGSFLKRLTFIPFFHIVWDNMKDERLSTKLRGEIEGILNWALEGWKLYTLEGLESPEIVNQYGKEYAEEQNDIADFVSRYYEITNDKKDRLLRQTILDDYEEYNRLHTSSQRLGKAALFQRLEEYYPTLKKITPKNVITYLGIKRLSNPITSKEQALRELNI